ncbi:pyridoxamine 5'-phosphate oxidase family protein [Microbacterium sp. CFBP9034]|uniref:pyridoxamine 5'-phosphate oxidase family protein n=1 Tax=Microbacterium sp. CFBP9034 TaxID=3096540 RepID=UPI002A6AA97F|nr:pyridoxamine 5'-phosphate oxidase family protein [Microbacterium sp. CFBP9034]MDY0908457.1 pyridoxamine 5'-phosphate oxidase family protein [Microbacterium sp. CFBP9034]
MSAAAEPFSFDPGNEVHARTLARLDSEQVGWFGTIGRDGFPHAVPVWFLWRDGKALIMSEPATAKVRNLRANERVLLHLEAGADGEQLTVLRGTAAISSEPSSAWVDRIEEAYTAKYDAWLQRLNLTTKTMADRYSALIEVTPHKLIAW